MVLVMVGDGVQVGTRVLVGVGGRVGVEVSVGGNTGSPCGPTGTTGDEPTAVGAACHASPPSVAARAASGSLAAETEVAFCRHRVIVMAKATVQMLTVVNPNTNSMICCRLVIFPSYTNYTPFMSNVLMSILP